MNFTTFEIVCTVIVAGVILLIAYSFWWCNKEEKNNSDDIQSRLRENKIIKDNFKSYMTFDDLYGCVILTKDNKLFNIIPRNNNMIINEIKFNNILDIKVDIHTKERNSMKIISIVPTFDKCQFIQKINMTITTEDDVYDLFISKDRPQFKMERIFAYNEMHKESWETKINELNRLKLLIEKNIKDIKQEV